MEKLYFETEKEYKEYFIKNYCEKEIYTYSGINVKFYEDQFEHCFLKAKI